MTIKTIDLENGFELVVIGDYKEGFKYERELLATFSSKVSARIFIRKKKASEEKK